MFRAPLKSRSLRNPQDPQVKIFLPPSLLFRTPHPPSLACKLLGGLNNMCSGIHLGFGYECLAESIMTPSAHGARCLGVEPPMPLLDQFQTEESAQHDIIHLTIWRASDKLHQPDCAVLGGYVTLPVSSCSAGRGRHRPIASEENLSPCILNVSEYRRRPILGYRSGSCFQVECIGSIR